MWGDEFKAMEHSLKLTGAIMVRVDGKAFHTFTKKFSKPFDERIEKGMLKAGSSLMEIQGAAMVYIQSDEISLLLLPNEFGDHWFGGEMSKIVSVTASMAASEFTNSIGQPVNFDSRAFCIPDRKIVDYFKWRQQDAYKNGVHSIAHSMFGHSALKGKSTFEKSEMIGLPDSHYHGSHGLHGTFLTKGRRESEVSYTDKRTGLVNTAKAIRSFIVYSPGYKSVNDIYGLLDRS